MLIHTWNFQYLVTFSSNYSWNLSLNHFIQRVNKAHIRNTASMSSSLVLIVCCTGWRRILIILHTFSIKLMSGPGDCEGQSKHSISFHVFQASALLDTWDGQLSSWKTHGLLPKCFATTGHKYWSRSSIYFRVFKLPSLGVKTPTPVAQTQPQNETDTRLLPWCGSRIPRTPVATFRWLFSTRILFGLYSVPLEFHQKIL